MMTILQEKKRALGRGLESLIPAARPAPAPVPVTAPGEEVREVAVEEIEPSPYQPRRVQDEAALEELAASIRAQGVLQPIVVRYISPPGNGDAHAGAHVPPAPIKYQLIAGERRWRASQRAGRKTVAAVVRQVSNEQAMEMGLVENLQREDLGPMEMAHAFQRLGREFGLTQEQMSARTGKERATIANYLRLLKLPSEVQQAIEHGELSFGHAKSLMAVEDPDVLSSAARKVVRDGLSVRATEELVNQLTWLASGEQPKKPPKPEDPNVRAARMELEGHLGCRVKILDHNGKGKVVIEYKSLEDFDRIIEALK